MFLNFHLFPAAYLLLSQLLQRLSFYYYDTLSFRLLLMVVFQGCLLYTSRLHLGRVKELGKVLRASGNPHALAASAG